MKPEINKTSFGSITVNKEAYDYDIIIRLNGEIEKRKKKLSKAIYGTSHTISKDEAKYIYEDGAEVLIIGSGQYGAAELSEEAQEYFKKKDCRVVLMPTPQAVEEWNKTTGKVIGLFHITC
jgi:hypothetical protein